VTVAKIGLASFGRWRKSVYQSSKKNNETAIIPDAKGRSEGTEQRGGKEKLTTHNENRLK
jgi:hypothetical protein|tara:strand:+ start:9185 stop:9364 length:180 start_codon:yes stop_codon:yes gene_type:complete